MGNEGSKLKGLMIDKTAVESNDFWTLCHAVAPSTNDDGQLLLSVFQGETVVTGQLWVTHGPMERAIKNLMIYRYPYILKYVSTWEQGGQKHLATERVRPLVAVIANLSDIQVCLGLRSILCSLIFLVEKAMARHLNICITSIYTTDNGSWRLGGFEYVWKSKEITKALLDLANAYRYARAIDPSEMKEHNWDYIEQYAFATLCEEILDKCTNNDNGTPHVQEFREYCANHLKHKNAQMRPKLSAVLLHPYFNHEFVVIHSFLFELPLKNVQEKQDFFRSLIDRLRYFNEEVVATQLAASLLSRMVLLDPTAQLCVTPYLLRTKTEYPDALFSNHTYTRHLLPHIMKMFRMRDAQIRLILLEYFMEYVRLLTNDELQKFILPHLLDGMHDTNDVLVAKTLRCLADLVPTLGAATVLGGNRSRLFSDGRPQAAVPDSTVHWVEPRSITPVMGDGSVDYMVSSSPLPDNVDLSSSFNSLPQTETNEQLEMPLRLSPDGGEDDKSAIIADGIELTLTPNEADTDILTEGPIYDTINETLIATAALLPNLDMAIASTQDDEEWSDWEADELQHLNTATPINGNDELQLSPQAVNARALPLNSSERNVHDTNALADTARTSQTSLTTDSYRTAPTSNASSSHSLKPPKINDDLNALDIQVQKLNATAQLQGSEFDFFRDMEPVIDTNRVISYNYISSIPAAISHDDDEIVVVDSNRFAALAPMATNSPDAISAADGDGWGVDDEDPSIDWHVNA